jgi:hypothetical protein
MRPQALRRPAYRIGRHELLHDRAGQSGSRWVIRGARRPDGLVVRRSIQYGDLPPPSSTLAPYSERDEDRGRDSDIGKDFVGPANQRCDHDREKRYGDEDIHAAETDMNSASSPSVHFSSLGQLGR